MCKHIKFDRNRWAPCAVCMKEKQTANTVKNEAKIRAEIAEYKAEIAEKAAQGKKASFATDEVAMLEKRLKDAGLPV